MNENTDINYNILTIHIDKIHYVYQHQCPYISISMLCYNNVKLFMHALVLVNHVILNII